MDRRERDTDLATGILAALEGWQSGMWTALPGILQSFDATKMVAVVQPSIQAKVLQQDGTEAWVTLPLLLDCPVVFPQGGDCIMTFPLAVGDEVLVVFASRCIDFWYESGGIQRQAEIRMHSLSDGFCLPGVRSKPRVVAGISSAAVELRSEDGATKVSLNPTTGAVSITAATINLSGTVIINGVPYMSHMHSGVQAGGSNTGGVV